ncbi:MAG: hypothetical protein Q9188_005505 [Gyalolechia gomerana]
MGSLGYLNNNEDNLLGYLKTMDLYHHGEPEPMSSLSPIIITPDVTILLHKMPHRTVIDTLIQHFFTEANWIYEMVDAVTFLERYNDWWSHPCRSVDDVEFAALLLRLCSYTAQFLPSANYTADTIFGNSLCTIRKECDATANALSSTSLVRATSTSIVRIHQLFFRACYLKNEGDMRGSWDILSEAIREAQELGLHLDLRKGQGQFTSEYNVELGKRTYWNLWLWDKFMCIILGRWPLIPDDRCTVSLPNQTVGTSASDINAPDTFCERRLQIRLTRLASELLSSTNGKQSRDPTVIDKHIRRLKSELIDNLPPAFRINDPEYRWDEKLPNLRRQREMFKISIFATLSSLLKPVITAPANRTQTQSASEKKLVAKLKLSLIEAVVSMLDSVKRLHKLMGGKQNRFFLLSFFTLEPAALLGMCLLSVDAKEGKHGTSTKSKGNVAEVAQFYLEGRKRLEESFARLRMLSEVSSIARIGVKILEKILARLDEKKSVKPSKDLPHGIRTEAAPAPRIPFSPVSEGGSAHPRREDSSENPSVSTAATAPASVSLDIPANLSITPPYSHSESSQNSPPFPVPDSWMNFDIWPDVGADAGNLGFNLFANNGQNDANLASLNAPSMQWPAQLSYWGVATTSGPPASLSLASDPMTTGPPVLPAQSAAWLIPEALGDYNGMDPNMHMDLDQASDWTWTGDSGVIGFGE